MLTFFIKSTVSLVMFYGFYHFFLRNQKILFFNRFYLILSLVFSMIIPLIAIPIKSTYIFNNTLERFNISIEQFVTEDTAAQITYPLITFQNILTGLFIIVSFILFIRFTLNIIRILGKIIQSKKIHNPKTTIVLIQEKTLPYSFFKYIFVNQSDFENGKIEPALLLHEEAHCEQYHSIDILVSELVKIFLWFNPIIWFFQKEIKLNHEYLADSEVLSKHDLEVYKNTLLNLVFRNNSTYLASNFNYSLTKKRLIMMTKNNSSAQSLLRKIAIVPLVLILTITLSYSQKNIPKESLKNFEKEWWYPILQIHNIKPSAFNNFDRVFETGSNITIENQTVTLTDAIFIVKRGNDRYSIIKSPLAYHDLGKNIIKGGKATVETYSLDLEKIVQMEKKVFNISFDLQIGEKYDAWIVDINTLQIKTEK
jgi:beta-lactamase regulating signal transducer with metallopeptidase domain